MPEKKRKPKHFTREQQQRARSKVSSESCARNGAKGARVTIERYGVDALFKRWQAWKLSNPSRPEALMIGVLTRLGVKFEREKRIDDSLYSMDFYLPDTRQAIEVDSRIHKHLDAGKRERNAKTKSAMLRRLGIACLVVWDTELLSDDLTAFSRKIEKFVSKRHRQQI